jgi:hypothetical protein
MFRKARYISLKTASSFGNSDWFLLTFRSAAFKDSIAVGQLSGHGTLLAAKLGASAADV